MKTFRHLEADYTPNDVGPPEKFEQRGRTKEEIGASELETLEEWTRMKEEDVKLDT